jgi:hypothetical protein
MPSNAPQLDRAQAARGTQDMTTQRMARPANGRWPGAYARHLRTASSRAPRMQPTWAPAGGPASVAWDDVVAVRIPKAPRVPMDLLAHLAFAAEGGARRHASRR